MSKRHFGLVMMIIGILAVALGFGLSSYNMWENYRAGIQAYTVLDDVVRHREEVTETNTSVTLPGLPLDSARELPILEMDGHRYIGTVSIPVIDVELPVQEDWSLALLKISPCRYLGSPYNGDLIICAHNYATHFGRLKNLIPGDEVIFTDVKGNAFDYTVVELETLAGTAVEEMESGSWDLTLFTCTLGGQTRVTVRCDLLKNDEA
ncbi:MAG: sortase [Lachnospiraceae bacterium]|nr:sortase [Lachnospiraceae bacterium]